MDGLIPRLKQSGAGALWVGPGWDGGLLGLALFLAGEVAEDPVAAASSAEALAFSRESVHAWSDAVEASGTATPELLSEAVGVSMAQFAPGASEEEATRA